MFYRLIIYTLCYFIMPVVPCIWSDGVRPCGYSFNLDGHDLCVSHRTCVSLDFVYDPLSCVVCKPKIDFLKSVGTFDKSCVQFIDIKNSWEAVRRTASRKQGSASWADESLRSFLFSNQRSSVILPPLGPVSVPIVEIGGGQEPVTTV